MGHVSTLFDEVIAWRRRKWAGFKADVAKKMQAIQQIFLKENSVSELSNYFSFDEFKSIFEWEDGAYYIGNHRLVDSFGVDEIRDLWDLSSSQWDMDMDWDMETSSILIKSQHLSLPSVVMNTNVSMENAPETVNNLKAQWLLKEKALKAKDIHDD